MKGGVIMAIKLLWKRRLSGYKSTCDNKKEPFFVARDSSNRGVFKNGRSKNVGGGAVELS